MNPFRILVADDHPIFRFGVCSLLGSHEGWEICGEATDGRDAIQKCKQLKPDLVILDIGMPRLNGVEAARQILKDNPAQRILVLTHVDSEQVIRDCLEAGVLGWVFKTEGAEEVTTAVTALQRHNSIFSRRVSDLIMHGYRKHFSGLAVAKIPRLSLRQHEVLQLIVEGKTSKEISVGLNMSLKTTETHRSNIMQKLGLHSIAELVLYAVRNGIVQLQVPVMLGCPQSGNGRADIATQGLY